MNIEEFSDEEWQDILDEFRLLVVRAGYTDWDAMMMEALEDEREDRDSDRADRQRLLPAAEQLRQYAGAFMRYLKARSSVAAAERRARLGSLLKTESGAPVEDFRVDIDGAERPIFADDDDPDKMIDALGDFLTELNNEDGPFWDRSYDGGDQ